MMCSLLKSRMVYSFLTGSVLGDVVVQISYLLLLKSNQPLIRRGRVYFLFWLLWNYCSLLIDVLLQFCCLSCRVCRLHAVGALIRIWMFEGPALWFYFCTQLQSVLCSLTYLLFSMRGKSDWLPDSNWDGGVRCDRIWDNKLFVTIETEVCLVVVPGNVLWKHCLWNRGLLDPLAASVRAIRFGWTPSPSLAVRGGAFLWCKGHLFPRRSRRTVVPNWGYAHLVPTVRPWRVMLSHTLTARVLSVPQLWLLLAVGQYSLGSAESHVAISDRNPFNIA